jgi:uncharacterized protein YdhG (YjbR/CyaY superfamily)
MKHENYSGLKTDFPAGMGKVAPRELGHAGYTKLKQLTKVTEAELLSIHGVGPKAIRILRETLKAKGMSFAKISQAEAKRQAASAKVDAFMKKLKHPFKAEVEMMRKTIMGVNKEIHEEIKWNAPSFSYHGEYLVTFNLWEREHIHLVFHNPMISKVKSRLLEGDYEHRRMAHFSGKSDIKARQATLVKAIKDLIKLQKK